MRTYIKIAGATYPASISGTMIDREWDSRASKTVRLSMEYSEAISVFSDNISWSIIEEQDDGTTVEYDNSAYCVAGPVTDHRDGTLSVCIGKKTRIEVMQDYINQVELENASLMYELITGEEFV